MSDSQKVSFVDISFTNMIQVEALLLLLIRKGIITKDEYQQQVEEVHRACQERTRHRNILDDAQRLRNKVRKRIAKALAEFDAFPEHKRVIEGYYKILAD